MADVEGIRVGDAMTKGVICVDIEDTVADAAEVMKKNDISSVIVTKQGDGVGIITERDIIIKVVAESNDARKIRSSEIMTSPLITLSPDASIDDAAREMRDKDIRRLVISEGNNIVGILSESDIVRIEPALHTLIQEHIKWDISDQHAAEEGIVAGVCESCESYSESLRSIDGRFLCTECMGE